MGTAAEMLGTTEGAGTRTLNAEGDGNGINDNDVLLIDGADSNGVMPAFPREILGTTDTGLPRT